MSSEKGGFTVSDKRHFTAEGQARSEETATTQEDPGGPAARAEGESSGRVELSSFLLGLAAQASLLLRNDAGGAEGGDLPAPDPAAARQIVSILEMLQDKTEGRRTDEESKLLDAILFELRMAYVARTKGGGA
jgi:hypothetical protein